MCKRTKAQIICDSICGVLMLLSLLVFLVVGILVPSILHPLWIIIPSAGLTCGIISIICNCVVSCKSVTKANSSKNDEKKQDLQ